MDEEVERDRDDEGEWIADRASEVLRGDDRGRRRDGEHASGRGQEDEGAEGPGEDRDEQEERGDEPEAPSVLTTDELMLAQRLIRLIPVGESVADAILKLVRSARPDEAADDFIKQHVSWGPGPRATQALMLGARARALLDGRLSPSVDDVIALAKPVLQHRMAITFAARADGVTLDSLVDRLTGDIG